MADTATLSTRLTPEQTAYLLQGIHPSRVSRDPKGFAHVEAWEIRRTLVRVFGHGGWSTDLQDMTLVKEVEHPAGERSRWTVIYRATVVLTVRAADGSELCRYHGTAIGEAVNQPSLPDAHDMALKSADSQALKRAAVNLGDQFGLSLYNDGATEPVVKRTLAAPAPAPEARPIPAAPESAPKPVAPAPKPKPPALRNPAPAPYDHAKFYALVDGCRQAAAEATDPEVVRGLYRKAGEQGLLGVPVRVPNAGEMPLQNFLTARGAQLAAARTAVPA